MSGALIRAPAGVDEGLDLTPPSVPLQAQVHFLRTFCAKNPGRGYMDAIRAGTASARHAAPDYAPCPSSPSASCGFVLLASEPLGARTPEQARILHGLITGIGFIGGGAILKAGDNVHGSATAVSLWNVGVIGAAVGFGYYDLGLILALSTFLVLALLTSLKRKPRTAASQDRGAGTEPKGGRAGTDGAGHIE